jgi:hypothetical protein
MNVEKEEGPPGSSAKLANPKDCVGTSDFRDGSWLGENSEIEFTNGKFVSTSINLKNKSAGDDCRDKTKGETILRAFRARTLSPSQGQSPTST